MWKKYYICEDIEESLDLLHRFNGDARIIAGGTDLVLEIEAGNYQLPALIDITRLSDLQGITRQGDRIFIGAAATFEQVIASELIRQHAPHLITAARTIAGRQIRNTATVVGNIVNASPAADSAPVLLTLDAHVHYFDDSKVECEIPLSQFMTGVKKTILPQCGLVTAISFPAYQKRALTSFRKLGLRWSMAISVVNVSITLFEEGGIIQDARVAFGAVAPTPVRSAAAEQALIGIPLENAADSDAPKLARTSVSPIDDFRASAKYRLNMVENLLRQELRKVSSSSMTEDPNANRD